ncbi:MAG: hypothetical protein LBR68_00565 [Lachnoclostridium sp.]|jgi:DNA-directed RNA polymerase subunit RPC12/RpoP|nr:hypothetical protein [Lachnoclostridium sp.]
MGDVLEYKCPSCGGKIEFDSSSQNMRCPYCNSEFEVEALKQYNINLQSDKKDDYSWGEFENKGWTEREQENIANYSCPSCGGEIICEQTTAATHCPYCGNPAIISKQFSGLYKPDFVIPFKLDKKDAKTALNKHYKGKHLLPKAFKQDNHIDKITGMYVPFWLYDCSAGAHMRFKATKVHFWSDSNYNYTKTDYYSVIREGNAGFMRIPADGSKKMDNMLMDSVEPFDYNGLKEFDTLFMSGYVADKYDDDAEACKPRINERVKNSIEKLLRDTATGYSSCVTENSYVKLNGGNVDYALLPIWMLNTKYKDKMYTFVMNGQTGKFIGDLPVDWGRFTVWLLGLLFGISILGTAGLYFINMMRWWW